MYFSVINLADLLLLLLIGMGPQFALVPFLEKTKTVDAETQLVVGRQMVVTAVITALVLFALGALLMHLLHISAGAVRVAGGIILASLAINVVHRPRKKVVQEVEVLEDPKRIALSLVPYLLNPIGITILIIASGVVASVLNVGLVVGLVLLVGAFDYWFFGNIDKVAKRLNPAILVVSEVVFAILLTAIAVQLLVNGLDALGIIAATPGSMQ
jgi:small neutral amino acid transporter SnatA (MarC family)